MDLEQYLKKSKKTSIQFSREADCSHNTIGKIKLHLGTPNLFIALKLYEASDCQISLYKLLSKKDRQAFKKWVSKN